MQRTLKYGKNQNTIFNALHGMQTWYSDEKDVHLSVKRMNCDKTEETSVQNFIPHERSFSLVLWEEWFVGGDPFYLKFWVTRLRWRKITDFQPIFARSSSAVTPSGKSSINTNRKSITRFPMSLRWSSYVAPKSPKGVSKTQNDRFLSKIILRLNKVCCKVSLCENCQRQTKL